MKYQPQHDLIDPDVPAPGTERPVEDPDAPTDAYIFDEHGHTVLDPGEDPNARKAARKPKLSQKLVMPAAFIFSIVFVGLTVWNISRAISGPPPLPKPSPFQVKQALYLGVLRVDAYKRLAQAAFTAAERQARQGPSSPAQTGMGLATRNSFSC